LSRTKKRPASLLLAALVCLAIAAVAFGGLILRSDHPGRIIFGAAWGALGVIWLAKYLMGTSAAKTED
jgi:Na+/proline symporter